MNSGSISSHELDEWEDACRLHGDSRSEMILRLIGEVRQCWKELDLRADTTPADRRGDPRLVANGLQNLYKDR